MPRQGSSAPILLIAALAAGGCGLGDDDAGGDPSSPQIVIEETVRGGEDAVPGAPTFPSTATKNTTRIAGQDAAADAAGVASAVFPATSDLQRPDAVALVDADDWQGAVAASVLTSGKIGAPLLVSDGEDLPSVTASALARLDPAGSELAENAQVIRVGEEVARPEGRRTAVIAGDDPFERAAAIDRFSASAEGARSASVVIASGERPEWAMPAAAYAARSGDAVLFAQRGALPSPTRDALAEHEKPDIYVLGPESVIGPEVVKELDDLGRVRRIAEPTPVESAIEFARYQAPDFGWGLVTPGHNFTLASTARPLDAAAAAALGTAGTFAPLLLTDEAATLPEPLESYLLDIQPGFDENPNSGVFNHVWILGNQETISVAQQGRVDELTELIPVQIDQGSGGGGGGGAPGGGGGGGGAPGGGGGGGGRGGAPGGTD